MQKVLMIKRGEEKKLFLFLLLFLFLIMGVEIGSGVSMSLFLVHAGADKLPVIFLLAALLNFGVVVAYVYLSSTKNNTSLFYMLIIPALLLLIPVRLLHPHFPGIMSYFLYILYEFLFSSVHLHFSVYLSDYFDTRESKRLFPIIFAGSRIGGITGGLILTFLSPVIGSLNLLFIWIFCLMLGTGFLFYISKNYSYQVFDYEKQNKESIMFFKHIKGGFQFMKGSKLLKSLTAGVFLLGLLSLIIKYLYSNVFLETFPQPDRLTAFYGMYSVLSSILGLLLQIFAANRIIDTFGIGAANTLYAAAFSSGFLGLAANFSFIPALWAKFSDEQLEFVLQDPVEGLFYNAIPDQERARARALSSGLIKPISEITGSLFLQWAIVLLPPKIIAILGFALSILFIITAKFQNHGYVQALMDMVKNNTLSLEDLKKHRWEKASKKDLDELYKMADSKDDVLSHSAASLILNLDEEIKFDRLFISYFKWKTDTRQDFLKTYLRKSPVINIAFLEKALKESDSPEKRIIIEYLVETRTSLGMEDILQYMKQNEDLELQNSALRCMIILENQWSGEAQTKVAERLKLTDNKSVHANLSLIKELFDEKYIPYIMEKINDSNRRVKIEALNVLGEIYQPRMKEYPEIISLVERLITSGAYHETRAAIKILSKRIGKRELDYLLKILEEPSGPITNQVIDTLKTNYSKECERFLSLLESPDSSFNLKENLIRLFQKLTNQHSQYKQRLKDILKSLIGDYYHLILEQECLRNNHQEDSFMADLHQRSKVQLRMTILNLLGMLLHQKVIISIEKALITKNPRLISNALELFENLWDKSQAKHLITLLYPSEHEEELSSAIDFTGEKPPEMSMLFQRYLNLKTNKWNLCAVLMLLKDSDDHELKKQIEPFLNHHDPMIKEIALLIHPWSVEEAIYPKMLTTIEKIIYLKSAPIFKSLKMDELKVIADISRERICSADELIIEKGDMGHTMFIIADGEVEIFLPETPPRSLTVLKKTDFFGEMALFGTDVRSASAKALNQVKLLCIDRDHFINLIYEKPDISVEIIKVLNERIRKLEVKQ